MRLERSYVSVHYADHVKNRWLYIYIKSGVRHLGLFVLPFLSHRTAHQYNTHDTHILVRNTQFASSLLIMVTSSGPDIFGLGHAPETSKIDRLFLTVTNTWLPMLPCNTRKQLSSVKYNIATSTSSMYFVSEKKERADIPYNCDITSLTDVKMDGVPRPILLNRWHDYWYERVSL